MNWPPLTVETIAFILDGSLDDATVNALVLLSLGYRYDPLSQSWDPSAADPAWRDGGIPDVIAHRPDSVKLTRAIPAEHKQLLKEKLYFPGYTISELTPQKTRRATAANWLLGVLVRQGQLT
ncbi:MAG: DUF1823 family protein [Cyanobacteriota bacterium]|nr:DUF1823 family protein [Cyanobacteriota bacterium]